MKRLVLQSVLAISICAALFLLFSQIPTFKEKFNPDISIENEEKIGDALFDFYVKKEKKVSNPELDNALKKITYRLVKAIGQTDYNYQFTVVESEQINAFTLPGGKIVIFTGLINITDAPEELAAVIAHEIGHAEKKHVTQRLIKELGLTLLLGVLTGSDAGILSEILRTVTSTVFDRRQETEADKYGLSLLENAHINPQNMAIIFRKLDDKAGWDKNLELLSTHPHNSSRIKNALEYKTKKDFSSQPLETQEWDLVKASLQTD